MNNSLYIDYSLQRFEEGLEIMSLYAKASIYCEEIDESIEVACARGYLFRPGGDEDWIYALSDIDAVSGDVHYVACSLEGVYRECFIMEAFVLDHIETKASHRNKAIGKTFIDQMLEDLAFLNVELVGLTPGYYVDPTDEQKAWNKRLVDFYSRLGFEMVESTTKTPVMAKLI